MVMAVALQVLYLPGLHFLRCILFSQDEMLNQEHRTVNECCSGHSALSLVRVGGFRLHLGVGGVMKEVGDFALLFTAAQIGGIQIKKKKMNAFIIVLHDVD